MKKLLYIIAIAIVALATLSCERRELTYDYSPYCEVVLNVDWSNMSEAPTGMTIMAYPQDGGTPTTIQSNTVTSGTLKLPAGVYNILVFNQIPSDFGTVSFRGMDQWDTAEVYSNETTSNVSWASSKSEATTVREPEDIAVATYTDVEICEDCIEKSTAQYKLTGERIVIETIDLKPNIVIKRTLVRVRVDGIGNLLSTRAVLTGMSEGYNFSTQQSTETRASHFFEDWEIVDYDYGEQYGETYAYFASFGIPSTTTSTRATDDWTGSIYIQMLLVDNETIIEHAATVTIASNSDVTDTYVDADIDVDIETNVIVEVGFSDDEDDSMPVLPDVKPEGSSDSGFSAEVEDWGEEEDYYLGI